MKKEDLRKTRIVCTIGPAVDSEEKLKELMLAAYENSDNIIKMVCDMVPTYKPSNNK